MEGETHGWNMLPQDLVSCVLDILRSEGAIDPLRSKHDPRPSRKACGAFRATCKRWQVGHDDTCTTLRLSAGADEVGSPDGWPLHGWGRFEKVTRVESIGIASHHSHLERTYCHLMVSLGCECIIEHKSWAEPRGVVWCAQHVAALQTLPALKCLALEAATDEALLAIAGLTALTEVDLVRMERPFPMCDVLHVFATGLPRLASLKLPQVQGEEAYYNSVTMPDRMGDVASALLELPALENLELEIVMPSDADLLEIFELKALTSLWLEQPQDDGPDPHEKALTAE